MITQAVVALLKADAGITALVSGRVYPLGKIPQDAVWPRIVVFKVSGNRLKDLSGQSNLAYPRIICECQGLTAASAKQISDAIRVAVKTGAAGVYAGFTVRWIWFVDEVDDYTFTSQDVEKGINKLQAHLTVWYEE